MLITLSSQSYHQLLLTKGKYRAARIGYALPIMAAITSAWIAEMKGAKLSVFLYILNRTFLCGKAAQSIPASEFRTGVSLADSLHCAATGLADTAIREALRDLSDMDLLTVYRTVMPGSDAERDARIFEINCKKLLDIGAMQRKNCHFFIEFDPLAIREGGSEINDDPHDRYMKGITPSDSKTREINLSFPTVAGRTQLKPISANEGVAMYVGKRKPENGTTSAPAPAVLQVIQSSAIRAGKATAARVALAKAKKPGDISKIELQSLIDKCATDLGLGYRVMVTDKPFGVLRKRMKDNPPQDIEQYVRYCFMYWPTLATQNRKAITKDRDRLVREKALPEAPNFDTFAYWYGYFFKAYQSHLAGRTKIAIDDKSDEVQLLKRQLAAVEREKASLARLVVSARKVPETDPCITPVIRRRPVASLLQPLDPLPEYDSSKSLITPRRRSNV